jgi:peptide/nickel transport system substrate-binding protein
VLRVYNYNALVADSLDPHMTRGGPIANVHSAIFSRLLRYSDERAGTIVPDLAAEMPEQPDELTYVIRLRPQAAFHDSPIARYLHGNLAGRSLTADDVAYTLERQMDGAQGASASQLAAIDSVRRTDARTLTIRLREPVAPFLSFLAGRHAFILPREVVTAAGGANAPTSLIGSGPFMLDALEPGRMVRLLRNPSWFAADDAPESGTGRPFLDGYDAHLAPDEDAWQRASFERQLIDATPLGEISALQAAMTTNLEDIVLEEAEPGGMLSARFLVDRPPFKDDRVRKALHLAIDRRALGDLMYPALNGNASWRLSGPVPPAMERWALDPDALESRDGYRVERERDLVEARKLWDAAMGTEPGELAVLFAGVPKPLVEKAGPAMERMLRDALNVKLVVLSDPSGDAVIAAGLRRNAEGASEGTAPFTCRFEDGGIDLDDCVYAQFHSGEPGNTYRLHDAALDGQLERQRAEFNQDARRELGFALQDYLIANVNARLDLIAPVRRRLRWGYVRNPVFATWHGFDERLANTWLDREHPAWAARAA